MEGIVLQLFMPDIFEIISQNLTQFDLIALSRTCHLMKCLTTPILYRSITIDCKYSQFEKEYLGKNTTYIKSKSNFLSLIRSLNSSLENNVIADKNDGPRLWSYIKLFKVVNLPLEFYDFESFLFGEEGVSFFKKARLNVLSLDTPLSFRMLKQLLNDKYSRETLSVLNFSINKHLPIKPFSDLTEDGNLRFRNLTTLAIGPTKQEFKMDDILKLIHPGDANKLENLKLDSQHKTFKLCDLLSLSDVKLKSNDYIFDQLNTYKNLKSLSLSSINLNQSNLKHNRDPKSKFDFFQGLQYLELTDVGIISSDLGESLLHTFFKNCDKCNLKYIRLDLRSTVDDLIPEFFNDFIEPNQVKELDLTIRYNNMYNIPLNQLIDQYLKMALIKQKKSLRKLSIEIKTERNLISLEEQLQKEHLLELLSNNFEKLDSLRIQVHFDYVLLYKNLLFQNIPNLKNFWIVGSSAVPMHFGLGNMYPGIFDRWWRIIYLPKNLLKGITHHPLHYIKIDECLFAVEHANSEIIQPKDSIDKLFESMTRVSFDNIMSRK
ncbi:hypothetical protein PICMEDRAFT_70666 [Pichia membranifaciens NRRL Y-2026]|uniref:F-box domain-containing protein n=1 Tax=Pichia membranifaciens NRRL Y-2026 TaxID=763406 RepID=A0A1E3NSP4_9ASCO|nr:hypothetical protein PICMEDRAFT_70666 [Pichia membranifaciens NRRL Y-2026]ODQ49092.1 hypothetical protein PICMEDRAFT_70666 [Pichia membranifaciens NRRL Y-2026]